MEMLLYSVHTSLQPPFLQGSPSYISLFPAVESDAILQTTGAFREGARDAVSWTNWVLAKSGLSVLQVGSGERCFVWPALEIISLKQTV